LERETLGKILDTEKKKNIYQAEAVQVREKKTKNGEKKEKQA